MGRRKIITVNTDCSGMEAPIQALRNLSVRHAHLFSCDNNPHVRKTIAANFPPEKHLYEDITTRENRRAPGCDLYVAGFPCQPFSVGGLHQGFRDKRGRGKIFFHILDYLQEHRPKIFILENVVGLRHINGGRYLKAVLKSLLLLDLYNVQHHVMDTKDHGVPHSRNRIYICGIRKDVDRGYFRFPLPIKCPSIERFLEKRDPKQAEVGLPLRHQTTALGNVRRAILTLRKEGVDPLKKAFVIDCDSSSKRCSWKRGFSPCITCQRGRGHWVTNRGRRLLKTEIMRLQGMDPSTFKVVVPDCQLGFQLGNAMSVNVLERLLVRLLPAAGLAARFSLKDRWQDGTAVAMLAKRKHLGFASVEQRQGKRPIVPWNAGMTTAKRERRG